MTGIRVRSGVVWASGALKTSRGYTGGPAKGLLHATITPSDVLPGYSNQATAPHETMLWFPRTKVMTPRTHYYFDNIAKALQNLPGGVDTNKDSVLQFELAGYLGPETPKGQFDILEAPNTYWEQLADLVGDIWLSWDIQPVFSRSFDASYRNRAKRMSGTEWDKFNGVCTHADVPENHHWDLPLGAHVQAILFNKIWSKDMPLTDDDVVKNWTMPLTKKGSITPPELNESPLAIMTRMARNIEGLAAISKGQQELIASLLAREPGNVDVEALTARFEAVLDGLSVNLTTATNPPQ